MPGAADDCEGPSWFRVSLLASFIIFRKRVRYIRQKCVAKAAAPSWLARLRGGKTRRWGSRYSDAPTSNTKLEHCLSGPTA